MNENKIQLIDIVECTSAVLKEKCKIVLYKCTNILKRNKDSNIITLVPL